MKEIHLESYPGGFPRDLTVFERDLYHLVSLFGASQKISEIFQLEQGRTSLFEVFREIEFSETPRLLTSIGSVCRHILDNSENNDSEIVIVGVLERSGKTSPLSFKEACNKILHANSISYMMENTNKKIVRAAVYDGSLMQEVSLYGKERNGDEWKVNLNIYDFVSAANFVGRSI